MNLGWLLVLGGLVIVLGLYAWARQRQRLGHALARVAEEFSGSDLPPASTEDAVLVSREHGQLVYINERARHWLGLNGGDPNLEFIAQQANPADSFLELFLKEGQSSFQLGTRWVEASSHTIPAAGETRTVVVLRELSANVSHADVLDFSLAMAVINEIGETVSASMSMEQLLQTLLSIVMKAIPAAAGEICLWDNQSKLLYPRGWVGDSSYLLALAEMGGGYKLGEGVSGWIARYHKPVLVVDVQDITAVQPKLPNFYRSYVGVPLTLGDRFIGTFELSHQQPNGFTQAHLALMQAISKQIAISIQNAELYADQSRRIQNMASLQDMAYQQADVAEPRRVYQTLNERIARLVSAQICGVLIYDEKRSALLPELPFFGLPDQVIQSISINLPPDSPQRDIWENQPYWVTNDAADEPLLEALGLKPLFDVAGIRNIALIPMEIGRQRIGMIQLSNKQSGSGFTPHDIQEIRLLAAQAAVVVENLRLYQREQRRETELTGLQEITHAIGALSQEGEFYSTINERIARLMGIAMCGILLYDEQNNRLVSQLPFYGVADELIAHYQIHLEPGGPLWDLWNDEDLWYTNNVQTNAAVHAAGLAEFAAAIGVTKTMMAVLSVGGRRIGVVQASNKLNGEDFTEKDARLLLIFATQAAAIIENARLVQDVERRAQEATSLRRVAELAGKILTTDDSFMPALAEISRLTASPLVFINVLDQQTGSLTTYPRWVYGMEMSSPVVQDIYTEPFQRSVWQSQQPLISNDLQNDPAAPDGHAQLARQVGITSIVLVPLLVGGRVLGELGVANRLNPPYSNDDERVVTAVAAQVASAIERVRLYEAAGQNLNRRVQELDAISRISNELTQTLDLEPVLDTIRQEAARATGADGSAIVLLRPVSSWKSPETPEIQMRLGDPMPVDGLADVEIQAVTRGAETVLVADYAASDLRPAPVQARSALTAAFLYEDQVVGVIHLYHSRPHHFDERAAAFLLTLAAKASLGYGNNRRYQEQLERSTRLRRRVEQLNAIFELGQILQTNADQVTMLESIVYGIQQSVGYQTGVVLLEDGDLFQRVAEAGIPLDMFERSRADVISADTLKRLLRDEYRLSESYFFPVERQAGWQVENLAALSATFTGIWQLPEPVDEKSWRDGDLLLVPLLGSGGNLLGLISLDRPQDNQRPDRSTVEILEIFAHQAAGLIENSRLYLASLQSAEQEARLNAIMEAVSSTLDTGQIIEAVAYGALRLVPFMQMTVALADSEQQGFDVLKVTINNDSTLVISKEHRLHLDGTALARTLSDGQDYLYTAGSPDISRYDDLRAWHERGERTSLIIPLVAGGAALGAMHLGSDHERADSFDEFRPLLKRMANLSAIAIQNARLFNRTLNLQTFNESVVESIQQGIIVLDKSGLILSVNDYMRQKYGWDIDAAIRQDLFAYSPELVFLKDDVHKVLDKGKPRERPWHTVHEGDRLLVRNFYLYPLRGVDSVRGVVLLVEDVTERARLERDIEARANQLTALTEVSSRITASLNRRAVITLALEEMGRVIQYDSMTLWSRNGNNLILEGTSSAAGVSLSSDAGTAVSIPSHDRLRKVVETQRPYSISHLEGWDRLPSEEGAQSWLGVPLVNQDNVVGVIAITHQEPSFYNTQSEQAAFAFANQVAVALSNAALFTESQRRTERLSLLNRVSVALAQSLDSENILEIALREIAQVMNVSSARALMIERELQIARVIVRYPRGDAPPDEIVNVLESAALQYIRRVSAPLIVDDVASLLDTDPIRQELLPRGITAYVIIPMTVGGQVIGGFEMEAFDGSRLFSPEQIELGQIISSQAGIAVQNTSLLEQTLVRTRELETLLEAAQATSLTLNLEEVFRSVVELTLHALDMDDCVVMLWDNVESVLEVQTGVSRLGDERIPPSGTTYNLRQYPARLRALEEREVLVIRANQAEADPTELAELQQSGDSLRVLAPLVARDQSIGLVLVNLQAPYRPFGHREIRLAQALGAQAAIAIQNARLSTETAALVEEGFIINNLSQAISSTLSIDDMIQIVRDQVPRVTDAEEMYLALYDAEMQMITFPMAVRRSGDDFDIPPRPLSTDEVSFVIRHRRSLVLGGGNWSADDMRRNLSIANGEGDAKSYLAVPIVAGDQVMGVLAVRDSKNPRAFGINDERLLTTVGAQMGAAIQNARLFQQVSSFAEDLNRRVQERTLELQKERDRIDILYRITSELARTLDMDRVLKRALEMVANAVSADDGVIMLINPMTDRLFPRAALRPLNSDGKTPQTHPAESLAVWLIQNGQYAVVDDLRQQTYWDADVPGADVWRSAIAVLLETNDDVQGVMVILSEQIALFTEAQVKLVIAAANQIAAAINNAELYHLIRDQAERLGMLLRQEQEETEKSNAIVEGIADGVMLADAEGAIILFNSAAEHILGLPRENVVGQTIFKLTGLFGGSASHWANAIQDWALDPQRHKPGEFLEETLDLGKRVVNVHLSPVHIGDRFLGTVSVFRDITKDVEVDRVKSEFVSNVSHELRTPMTSIKGFADLLLMGVAGQVSDNQRTFLLKIKTNADRLGQLVDDLLNISKIDAGDRLSLELVDVDEVVTNVVSVVSGKSQHEAKELEVMVEIEPGLPPIQADPHKLTQILTNLVDNAFNYTYEGGSIRIHAGLQPDGQHVLIAVKDTGIGIPEEFRSRIWQRFERFDEHALVMDVAGTGLGLSIVKELVQMHNGEVWFESEMGKGTTFFVSLPIEQPQADGSD